MRTALVAILLLAAGTACAGEAPGVSIDLKDVPLADAIDRLQGEADFRIGYSHDLIEGLAPVTLRADGEPAERVLRRMLRPRGLEFIRTADALGAVIPAESDVAMAKTLGSAVRTFSEFARMLDRVEQNGNELKLPEHAERDVRAFAEAIIDYHTAWKWFSLKRTWLSAQVTAWHAKDVPLEVLQRLASAHDADVRAGAALAAVSAGWLEDSRPERDAGFRALRKEMALHDADVLARACWLRLIVNTVRRGFNEYRMAEQALIDSCLSKPEWEVRAAIAGVSYASNWRPPDVLRGDPVAAVRAVAWQSWLRRGYGERAQLAFPEFVHGCLVDANPVIRGFGLVQVTPQHRSIKKEGDTYVITLPEIEQALNAPPLRDDPWLKLTGDVVLPIYKPTGRHFLDLPAKLVVSDKPSHRLLGCALALHAVATNCRSYPDPWPEQVDPPDAAPLANSDSLCVRVVGLLADGQSNTPDAAKRLADALGADDEIVRLVALLSCTGAPATPSEAVLAAIRPMLGSPMPAEQLLAARAMCRKQPVGAIADLLLKEPGTAPVRLATRIITRSLKDEMQKHTPEDYLAAGNAAFRIADPGLQTDFLAGFNYYGHTDNRAEWERATETFAYNAVCNAHPLVLREMFGERRFGNSVNLRPEAATAAFSRVQALFTSEDSNTRRLALAMATNACRNNLSYRLLENVFGPDLKGDAETLVGEMIKASLAAEAAQDREAGLELLTVVLQNRTRKWREAPPWLRESALQTLGLIEDETHGGQSAEILAALYVLAYKAGKQGDYRRDVALDRLAIELQNDTEVMQAMDAANKLLTDSDRPNDKAVVLAALAEAEAAHLARPAIGRLEKLLQEAELSVERRCAAVAMLGKRPELLSPEYTSYLMQLLGDETESLFVRREILKSFRDNTGAMPALLDRLIELAKDDECNLDSCSEMGTMVFLVVSRAAHEEAAEPEWLPKAAELGRIFAHNERWPLEVRSKGIRLYLKATREDPVPFLDEFLLNEQAQMQLRKAAVWAAVNWQRDGRNAVGHLIEVYDALQAEVRAAIAANAMRGQGADDERLFLHVLNDPELRPWFAKHYWNFYLKKSSQLEAALGKLLDDPIVGHAAERWMKMWK